MTDDLEEYREIARKIMGTPACAAIIGLISQVEHDRARAEAAEAERDALRARVVELEAEIAANLEADLIARRALEKDDENTNL